MHVLRRFSSLRSRCCRFGARSSTPLRPHAVAIYLWAIYLWALIPHAAAQQPPPVSPPPAADAPATAPPPEVPAPPPAAPELPPEAPAAAQAAEQRDQTPPSAEPEETEPEATKQPDLNEIEQALAADAQASESSGPAPAPASSAGIQSMNPDLSAVFDMALAYFSDEDHLQTGHHDPEANGFNLQQLEVSLAAPASPYLRLDAHILFSEHGVEPEEVYATTLGLPGALQARFGQMLSRFGRVNEQHPHRWRFVDQPFALGRVFGGDGSRGLGAELSWLSPLPWYFELVGAVTNPTGEGARSFFGGGHAEHEHEEEAGAGEAAEDAEAGEEHEAHADIETPADLLYILGLEQFFPLTDDWSLAWGLSLALGPNASFEEARTDVFGTDLYLKYRPLAGQGFFEWSLASEWLLRRRQVPDGELEDVSGFVQTFLRFAPHWGSALRYEFGSPERIDGATPLSALDPHWTRARHRTSLNLSFWPTEFSRFRLQGARDDARWRDDPIYSVFLNAEVSIGPHAAHSF